MTIVALAPQIGNTTNTCSHRFSSPHTPHRPLLERFARVSRAAPCRVCGRVDWCLAARDGNGDAICARVESPHRRGEAGWFHAGIGAAAADAHCHAAETSAVGAADAPPEMGYAATPARELPPNPLGDEPDRLALFSAESAPALPSQMKLLAAALITPAAIILTPLLWRNG